MKETLAAVLLSLCLCAGSAGSALAEPASMTESIQTVKQRHTDALMAIDGVMAVGIGLADDGSRAIIVTVEIGNERAAARLPGSLDGYPLIIQYSSEIHSQEP